MNLFSKPVRRMTPLGLLVLLIALWSGCGDIYRPVANPILQPGGDPQLRRQALVVNNSNGAQGTTTEIDVSGDSNLGNFPVGRSPVHGAYYAGGLTRAFVANKGEDTISFYSPMSQGSAVSTVTLPSGSAPVYVFAQQASSLFVAESGSNKLGVVNIATGVLSTELGVGTRPVAITGTPDNSKVFVANQGDGTVTVVNTPALTLGPTISVGTSPSWLAVKDDGTTVYVCNQGSGTVSVIDVASSTVVATLPVGSSPRMIRYDGRLRRLYVANTGSNTVSVFNADPQIPAPLATVNVGTAPSAVTSLSDGSKFYVANSGCADPVNMTSCGGNTVSVVDALSFAVRTTVTVGTTPLWLDSSPDSARVIVANRDSNNVSSIRTSDDTVVATIVTGSSQPVFVVISR